MKLIRRFGAVISLLLVSTIILSGCVSPSDVTDNLYTKNVYPDTIAGPFTIGDIGNPYGAGYFNNLYVNGVLVNGSVSGMINESTQTTLNGFLVGNGSYVSADPSTYLKTDASNGPITGDLLMMGNTTVSSKLTAGEIWCSGNISMVGQAYSLSNTCYNYSGTSYIGGPDIMYDYAFWWGGVNVDPVVPGVDFSRIDGSISLDCGLYDVFGTNNLTIWYTHGDKIDFETWLDAATGGAWVCDDYSEGVYTALHEVYSYTGNPSDWTQVSYLDPPSITGSITQKSTMSVSGDINAGGNFTQSGSTFWINNINPKILLGSASVPFLSDYIIQAFKATMNPDGNMAGMISGLQDSSTDPVNYQIWGLDTGLSLYGDTNYNWPVYGTQAMMRFDNNGHYVANAHLISCAATLTGGGHPGAVDKVYSLTGVGFEVNSQGCDPSSFVQNFYGIRDETGHSLGFNIDNYYGIYLGNHSADVTNSWGIWNEDRSYLGGLTVLTDGELQPASVADATASNNSIYLSTDTGNLSYKDTTGSVHMFAWQ